MKDNLNKNDNLFYYILSFSLLIHLMFLFLFTGIKIKKNIFKQVDREVEVNIVSPPSSNIPATEKYDYQNFPEQEFKPINIPDNTITPPNPVEQIEKPVKISNNLFDIPENIPLHYKVTKRLVKRKSNIGTSQKNSIKGKVKTSKKSSKPTGGISKAEKSNFIRSYLSKVRGKIEKNKKYPIIARKMDIEGVVKVKFGIDKKGKVLFSKIVKTSGYGVLDRAAINAIENSEPFPAIPDKLGLEKIIAKVSLLFEIE